MNAKTKIIALACVALLALTGTASAHHGANTTKVWAGKVAGTTAATDPATAIGGHALLVDGTNKNLLAVKVRNLKPNTAYSFALDGVSDFAATTATTDENGKLKGFVTSDTFNATDGATYTVVVKEGDTTVASSTLAPVQRKGFGHRATSTATTSTATTSTAASRRPTAPTAAIPATTATRAPTTARRPRPSARSAL